MSGLGITVHEAEAEAASAGGAIEKRAKPAATAIPIERSTTEQPPNRRGTSSADPRKTRDNRITVHAHFLEAATARVGASRQHRTVEMHASGIIISG